MNTNLARLTELARQEFRRPRWLIPVVTVVLFVVGFFFLLVAGVDTVDSTKAREAQGAQNPSSYLQLQIASWIIGWIVAPIAFPFALKHDPRELTEKDGFAGPPKAMIATVIVCATAMSAGSLPLIVVTLASLMARKFSAWTWAALVALMTSGYADIFLTSPFFSAGGFSDEPLLYWVGYFSSPLVLLLPGVFVGLYRGRARADRWRLIQEAHLSSEQLNQQRQLARREERTRIARDMHDSLSHRLSLIAVHSGALAFRDNLDAASVRTTANTIRDQAQAAVEDLRTVLSALREADELDEDPQLPLEALVEQARAAGDTIQLDVEGMPEISELDTLGVHAMHRVVQECLTNARKHAPGQTVTIQATRRKDRGQWLVLRVTNPIPVGVATSVAKLTEDSAQVGLTGLAERVKLTGGTFKSGPDAGLFVVEVSLPLASNKKKK